MSAAPTRGERSNPPGPLDGVRVIDLTIARAGPTCSRQLADLGADVVHVGNPLRGDLAGSDNHNLHRSKRSLLLDLKSPGGHAAFLRLAANADVLVENYRADVKHRLRIDYETLRKHNPRLVYASISGFGQDGPYRDRPGFDLVAQGMGGLMSVTGPPGQGPWRAGIAVSDTASGTFLTQGVLAALFARERSGRGQWVHTSLLESMVNFMDFQATRWLIDGEIPRQAGNDHPTIFPMGTLATQDGHINVAPVMGWKRFLTAIDGEEVDADPRFCDATLRSRNRKELQQVLERKLACRTSAEWTEILNAADIACGPVYSLDEVFSDPQVVHLALTRKVDHPNDGSLEVLRHPVTLSETPTAVTRAAPVPGAHTREVLAECGFTPSEIDDLVDSGAAACEGRGTMFR